ncbi:unnamed protein product [Heterobilharzia americana]|nr:unnamed protein product [Heterobilharzia americana]
MIINRLIIPKIIISSNLFLTLNLFYWFSILLITIGLIWLIIRYHFIPIEMKVNTRNRVHLGLTISLFILALSIILACFFYLIGGYLYTEGCRYINPEENIIHNNNNTHYDNSEKTIFPIDKYINDFINHNCPIYGILYNCRKNQGILEAFDSIKDFDMKALNDPEMLKRFSHVGKQIMIDSLRSINVDEIFPKQTDDNLAMASRLDDFIVNYNDVRLKLPKYYLTIQQSSSDQSGNYIPWSINDMWNVWDAYYSDILSYHLSVEQMNRLNTATEKVRTILTQLDNIISQIDSNLTVLSGLKKIGPHVAKLQNKLITLKNIMNNKTYLIDRAIELFDQHIQRKTPEEADKLIMKYGPKIMSKVGQCHRLYDAAVNINNAICDQFVSVLNGFWFLIGWITLIGTLMILFSLILLMHKPPMTEKSYHKKLHVQRSNRIKLQ